MIGGLVSLADAIIALLLLAGVLRGFKRGLLREAFSLVGFACALFLANQYSGAMAPLLADILGPMFSPLRSSVVSQTLSFVLIVAVAFGFATWIGEVVHRAVGLFLPGFLNRFAGLTFGLAESTLTVTIALLVVSLVSPVLLRAIVEQSFIASNLLPVATTLFSVLPKDLLPLPLPATAAS